jgi:hypothetical protein
MKSALQTAAFSASFFAEFVAPSSGLASDFPARFIFIFARLIGRIGELACSSFRTIK